ncbi:MAG: hypothetical protein AAB550_03625 [Patescibacteria group bacterium]
MDYLTKDQVDILKHEIDILMNSKYQSKTNELVRETTLQELEKRKGDLENWKLEIENLRVLGLTIANEPTRSNVMIYGAWVKKNIGEDVIMDITIDSRIVAGAQIVWNGKYKDYAYVQRLLS